MSRRQGAKQIIIPPFFYIHVKDQNEHTYRLVTGPRNFTSQDHETIVTGDRAVAMMSLPPRHYCVIEDPVQRDENNKVVFTQGDQV